jgi:hypothetical protein
VENLVGRCKRAYLYSQVVTLIVPHGCEDCVCDATEDARWYAAGTIKYKQNKNNKTQVY